MPELPEVETIARGLAKRVTGEVIESVWLGQKKEPLKSPAPEIVAALERSLIAERVRAGLRNARAKGTKVGRPRAEWIQRGFRRFGLRGSHGRNSAKLRASPRDGSRSLLPAPKTQE